MKTNANRVRVKATIYYTYTEDSSDRIETEIEISDKDRDELIEYEDTYELIKYIMQDFKENEGRYYDDLQVDDVDIISYEILGDIPPAEVMKAEGEKGLFDEQ